MSSKKEKKMRNRRDSESGKEGRQLYNSAQKNECTWNLMVKDLQKSMHLDCPLMVELINVSIT